MRLLGQAENRAFFPLVPKLHLGTPYGAKLCFAGGCVRGPVKRASGNALPPKLSFANYSGMRSRYRVTEPHAPQFITSTVVGWLPVFTTDARCKIVTDSLECCRTHKSLKIHALVILDNHLHAIVAAPDLPRVVADFKRHTARALTDQLRAEECDWLLHLLRQWCPGYKTESDLQFWQEGFHPQALMSDEVMEQSRAERD